MVPRRLLTSIFSWSKAKMTTRVILIGVITVALLVGFLIALTSFSVKNAGGPRQSPHVGLRVGERAPDFILTDLSGKKVSLSDYRGRPVMLNFWYPSCSDCVHEVGTMQGYYTSTQAQSKHFVILAVNFVDDKEAVRNFVQQRHLTYPIIMDEYQQVATMYQVSETPTSYFIDSEGIIQSVLIGPVRNSFLQRVLADPERANRTA